MTIRTVCYIPHRHRLAYETAGWEVTPLRLPHALYSCLAEWVGVGEPVFPSLTREATE